MLEYLYDASSPTASLLESKLLMNSIISDSHKGACFMTIDLKDYFYSPFYWNLNIYAYMGNIFYQISDKSTT